MVTHLRIFSIALALATLLAGCSTSAPTARQDPAPRFVAASCPPTLSSGVTVRCGSLIVPENHAAPGGPTLRLAVAVFKSEVSNPFHDPVVFLTGGPGDPAIGGLGQEITPETENFIVGDRDLIVVDYRGVGYSHPVLACPQVRKVTHLPLAVQRRGMAAALAVVRGDYRQCHAMLVRRGIDLSAYTTSEIAADVADLRSALRYRQINLYAVSYGTRVALAMMRDHPQGIRSVVLDSVLPPQVDDAMMLRRQAAAFTALFAGCAASAACHAEFPQLGREFYGLVARLQTHPLVVRAGSAPPLLLTGTMLAQIVFLAMYSTPDIPLLPRMIHALTGGDLGTLTSILPGLQHIGRGRAIGLTTSVTCSESVETDSPAQIAHALRTVPSPLRPDAGKEESLNRAICTFWGVKAVSTRAQTAVQSAIPTLILDGQYDPVTPPSYGAAVLKGLSHGYRFVFPGLGHGVRYAATCANDITQRFLDTPSHRPDGSCIGSMPPAF